MYLLKSLSILKLKNESPRKVRTIYYFSIKTTKTYDHLLVFKDYSTTSAQESCRHDAYVKTGLKVSMSAS